MFDAYSWSASARAARLARSAAFLSCLMTFAIPVKPFVLREVPLSVVTARQQENARSAFVDPEPFLRDPEIPAGAILGSTSVRLVDEVGVRHAGVGVRDLRAPGQKLAIDTKQLDRSGLGLGKWTVGLELREGHYGHHFLDAIPRARVKDASGMAARLFPPANPSGIAGAVKAVR